MFIDDLYFYTCLYLHYFKLYNYYDDRVFYLDNIIESLLM